MPEKIGAFEIPELTKKEQKKVDELANELRAITFAIHAQKKPMTRARLYRYIVDIGNVRGQLNKVFKGEL